MTEKTRCDWVPLNKDFYVAYHDNEWGQPVHDDQKLFEMLILEGAQAGLSWETILKRREGYRRAFHNFDISKCSELTDTYLEQQRENEEIIRNKLKIYSVRKNALIVLDLQKEFGSFDKYLWGFVNHRPIINQFKTMKDMPAKTDLSDKISKDMKKRGMSFVGSTIIYAYMQAIGMIDDHMVSCFCRESNNSS